MSLISHPSAFDFSTISTTIVQLDIWDALRLLIFFNVNIIGKYFVSIQIATFATATHVNKFDLVMTHTLAFPARNSFSIVDRKIF